jgi:hypothetical protein
MTQSDFYPASTSNQTSEEHYNAMIGQTNRGTCSKVIQRVLRYNGSYQYFTYHLTYKS